LTDQPPNYPPPPQPPGGGYPPLSSGGYEYQGYQGYQGYPPPQSGGPGYQGYQGYQGYPPPSPGGYGYPQLPQSSGTNGFAIASLVCSLVGWCFFIGPILGLVFGFVALNQIKQTGQGGRGMAIAGIVVGGVGIAMFMVYWLFAALLRPHPHLDSGAPPTPAAVVITVAPQTFSPGLVA
jgi:hypothetical protein